MADESSALCNSDDNHKLTLEQPTKYTDDIEQGGTFPEDEENPDGDEEEAKVGVEEVAEEGDKKESKIPLLYQVEPGCTPLSCYSAIITFIIMTIGVFWLLLISPPKNSVPVPIPVTLLTNSEAQVSDLDESYDEGFSPGPLTSSTVIPKNVSLEASTGLASPEGALDRIIRIVKDSNT